MPRMAAHVRFDLDTGKARERAHGEDAAKPSRVATGRVPTAGSP